MKQDKISSNLKNLVSLFAFRELNTCQKMQNLILHEVIVNLILLSNVKMLIKMNKDIVVTALDLIHVQIFNCQMMNSVKMLLFLV